jgi:predicted phosphate transport protein (TIGR00153 family)
MFRFRLIPREERFFEMFNRAADNALAGAIVLRELLEDHGDVDRNVSRLKEIEHRGDEVTHEIFDALNRSFITPFERDDVGRLASGLDDVLDWVEEAALRVQVYKIAQPTSLARHFARIIVAQAESIRQAVPLLETLRQPAEIQAKIVEIHRLENEADVLMVQALGTLYDGVADVAGLVLAVKWGDIYQVLEGATDKAEDVGTALESIIVKQS